MFEYKLVYTIETVNQLAKAGWLVQCMQGNTRYNYDSGNPIIFLMYRPIQRNENEVEE